MSSINNNSTTRHNTTISAGLVGTVMGRRGMIAFGQMYNRVAFSRKGELYMVLNCELYTSNKQGRGAGEKWIKVEGGFESLGRALFTLEGTVPGKLVIA